MSCSQNIVTYRTFNYCLVRRARGCCMHVFPVRMQASVIRYMTIYWGSDWLRAIHTTMHIQGVAAQICSYGDIFTFTWVKFPGNIFTFTWEKFPGNIFNFTWVKFSGNIFKSYSILFELFNWLTSQPLLLLKMSH
jgi:hypothetical protein